MAATVATAFSHRLRVVRALPLLHRPGHRRRIRGHQLGDRRADPGARARPRQPRDQRQLLDRRGARRVDQPGAARPARARAATRLARRLPARRRAGGGDPAGAPPRAGEPALAARARPRRRGRAHRRRRSSARRGPSSGAPLDPVHGEVVLARRAHAVAGARCGTCCWRRYRARSAVVLALMVSQAFFYNAIFFTYALVLTRFHGVDERQAWALYIVPFALGNVLGPLLLGPLFDRVGRRVMIAATYALSGVGAGAHRHAASSPGVLDATTQTLAWSAVFFLASAAASSAYLTVSEVFPLEMRALAISIFYAVGTGVGGFAAPALFGALIETGSRANVFVGYAIGRRAGDRGGGDRMALGGGRRAQAAGAGGAAAGGGGAVTATVHFAPRPCVIICMGATTPNPMPETLKRRRAATSGPMPPSAPRPESTRPRRAAVTTSRCCSRTCRVRLNWPARWRPSSTRRCCRRCASPTRRPCRAGAARSCACRATDCWRCSATR